MRQTTRDMLQRPLFRGGQIVLDEKMTVLEQVPDFLFQPLLLAGGSFGRARGRPTAFRRQLALSQFFRTLATARKIALVSSLMMWNSQIWWGTLPNTARKGSG